jgi:hypothetical protein
VARDRRNCVADELIPQPTVQRPPARRAHETEVTREAGRAARVVQTALRAGNVPSARMASAVAH